MTAYTYRKTRTILLNKVALLRLLSLLLMFVGFSIVIYAALPLIMWQIYFANTFTSQNITIPIPKTTMVNAFTVKNLFAQTAANFNTNYIDAKNWFPTYKGTGKNYAVTRYALSIPKLGIANAIVATNDYDLSNHLVNYGGTAIPGELGNAVIFGHSTLPQLFNPKDYKTIFANAYKLTIGDSIIATINNVSYRYTIRNIAIVDPADTSLFAQEMDKQNMTIVTCTPPGTTWKRLILKAELDHI